MKNNNTMKIVSSYLSIILGAGFISGKELFFFFGRYNYFGIVTLFISCILFALVLKKQLDIMFSNSVSQYLDFTKLIFYKTINSFISNITLLFLLVTMSAMVAGFCACISDAFNIPLIYQLIFIFVLTIFTIFKGVDFIVIVNSILAPIMFVGIIIIGIYTTLNSSIHTVNILDTMPKLHYFKALIFAFIYISFNSLTSVPMMCNLTNLIDSKKTINLSALVSCAILFILGFSLLLPMIIEKEFIKNTSIPILTLLSKNSMLVKNIYLIVLLCAIFSTLISSSLSVIQTLKSRFKNTDEKFITVLVVLLAITLSLFGFSNFVNVVYPLFGILGLIQIYFIVFYKN